MNANRKIQPIIVAILIASLFGAGCSLFRRPDNFDAIELPASERLKLPDSARQDIPTKESRIETASTVTKATDKPMSTFQLVADKSKKGLQTVGRAALVGMVWISLGLGKSIIDDALGRDEEDKDGFDPDPLWHQGYGFNNPNNERIRNGQPVLNFDGTEAK